MLKVLKPSVRARARRPETEPRSEGTDVRHLYQQVERQHDIVACGQRAIARGRLAHVEGRCRMLQFALPSQQNTDRARQSPHPANSRLAGIAKRLDHSHRRLLAYSASIEMERDRLDVLRTEIDQLAGVVATDAGKIL